MGVSRGGGIKAPTQNGGEVGGSGDRTRYLSLIRCLASRLIYLCSENKMIKIQ